MSVPQDTCIAWALAAFWTQPDGTRQGRLIAHDFQPAESSKDGKPGVTIWEYEVDGLGFESMCDALGEPTGPDGLYVFECDGAFHDAGDGWERDPSSELEGEWRSLRPAEWAQVIKNPNLEAFCAMDEAGQRIEWQHPEGPSLERIEVARVEPDHLMGIVPSDDGTDGWAIVARSGADETEIVKDQRGPVVFYAIQDAAESLRTGVFWRYADDLSEK